MNSSGADAVDDARISAFPDRFGESSGEEGANDETDRVSERRTACRSTSTRRLRPVETGPKDHELANLKPSDLKPLADQLMAIARQLRGAEFAAVARDMAEALPGASVFPQSPANSGAINDRTQDRANGEAHDQSLDPDQRRRRHGVLARKAYAARRRRAAIFGNPDLFGEPAWDILLDLYIAHVERKDVSVSSACIGSAAPPTTGLRWLGVLADHGLVLREHDPADQRRVLVRLTPAGLDAMDRYFTLAAGAS
ncbi:hypothetical protein EH32_07300 [Erythrobacter litoralis]|uniref:HTH marR-type domain-containing protein n=1 Tax=Erythrobacter litoralis TaxID=39960 RepID=A0A074MZT4_9SPHN|nr:hypothetical protein EH32_07300 [Erythrobacter litoralis]